MLIKSCAKINIFLDVYKLQKTGYHSLRSIFALTDLHDEIYLETCTGSGISVESPNCELPEDNLLVKAYNTFYKHAMGVKNRYNFKIIKKIPIGGGLGGGSSNAAAVLKIMNRIEKTGYSSRTLERIGAEIGSDVPFFIRGGIQKVFGRGEILCPIKSNIDIYPVLTFPQDNVLTPAAYRFIDQKNLCIDTKARHDKFRSSVNAIKNGNREHLLNSLYNTFEEAVFEISPSIKSVKERIIAIGGENTLMSGSGSTLVTYCKTESESRNIAEILRKEGLNSLSVRLFNDN